MWEGALALDFRKKAEQKVKAEPPVPGTKCRGTEFYMEFGRCCLVPGASLGLFVQDVWTESEAKEFKGNNKEKLFC